MQLKLYSPKPAEFYFCGRCNKFRSPHTYGDDNRYYCHPCTLNLISKGAECVSNNPDTTNSKSKEEKSTRKRKTAYRYTARTTQENREQQILDLIRDNNFLTAVEVGAKIDVNKSSAYRLLKPLADNNQLVYIGKYFIDPTFWDICQDSQKLADHIVLTLKNHNGQMTALELREYYKIVDALKIDRQVSRGYRDGKWQRYRLGNPPNNIIVSLRSPSGNIISLKEKILDLIRWNPGINNRSIFKELETVINELDTTLNYHDCTAELKKEGLIYTKRTFYNGVCYYPTPQENQLEDAV